MPNKQEPEMEYEKVIAKVQAAIDAAWQHQSGLPEFARKVPGLISDKQRHLLHNLCSAPGTVYLEAGLWQGASLIAALAGNERQVQKAYAIDDWYYCSSGRGAKELFDRHVSTHLGGYGERLRVFDENLFDFDPSRLTDLATVFYYDADHLRTGEGVLHFADVLSDPCIIVLDDWDHPAHGVQAQWRTAVREGPLSIVQEWELPSRHKADLALWWCGVYVAVIERK